MVKAKYTEGRCAKVLGIVFWGIFTVSDAYYLYREYTSVDFSWLMLGLWAFCSFVATKNMLDFIFQHMCVIYRFEITYLDGSKQEFQMNGRYIFESYQKIIHEDKKRAVPVEMSIFEQKDHPKAGKPYSVRRLSNKYRLNKDQYAI